MSRATVITLSVLLFVGLVAAVTIGVLNYVSNIDKRPTTSTKAVQEMCQPTDYKEACFKSLSNVNSDDPKELVKAAFESTKAEISEVASKSRVLKELEKDPKTAEAVKDCKAFFQDATDDLQRSFEEIGEFDLNKAGIVLENIKIFLSATMTYQETCLDLFDNTTGDASEKVRKILQTSMQMSSNGLAIVNEMANMLGTLDISSFNRRRLLADDRQVAGHDYNNIFPNWLRSRRLLSSTDDNAEENTDNTLLEDDEPDRRRRRLLRFVHTFPDEFEFENYQMPTSLGHHKHKPGPGPRRRLLVEDTKLVDDLKTKANVVVAKDGSGKYKTIEESFNDIPKYANESFIIYVKEGVYNEYLVLYKWMTHVVLIGDGPTKTRITNNKNFADGVKTFKTATLSVLGDFFMAKDIGIENSAGAIKHQAVALRVQSDQSIFYNCHFDGYQDTLYTHTYRQFYRNCRVTGTIDFIFGDAAAFFQNCTFVVRKPLENQRCIVTAQGRMERHQPTGIIIHNSRFEADPDYYPVRKTNTAYLGRPWKEYSKTIVMESFIDDLITPDGWLPWEGNFGLETCYYGEYSNNGPGSDMSNRVKWRGIKHIVHARAEKFMPPALYDNDEWIRASGVPYDPYLSALAPEPGNDYDEDPNAPTGSAPFLLSSDSSGSSSSTSSSSSASQSSSSSSSSTSSSSSESTHSQGWFSSSSGSTPSQGWFSSSSGSTPSEGSSSSSSGATPSGGSSSSGATPSSGSSSSGSTSSGGWFSFLTGSTPSEGSSSSSGGSSSSSSGATPSGGSSSSSSGATPSSGSSSSTSGGTPSQGSPGDSSSTTTPSTSTGSTGSTQQQTPTDSSSSSSTTTTTPSTGEVSTPSSITEAPTAALEPTPLLETPSPSPSASANLAPMTTPVSSSITGLSPTVSTSLSSSSSSSSSSSPSSTSSKEETTISGSNTGISPTASSTSSPSSSPTKPTGPVTNRELERILMTNEEMGEEEDHVNDDMAGNIPDGDEPSPAMVQITPSPAPSQSLSLSPLESIISSPSPSLLDEAADLLGPATSPGPGPAVEVADKEPPTVTPPPPKKNNARSNAKVHNLQLILSAMLMLVAFML